MFNHRRTASSLAVCSLASFGLVACSSSDAADGGADSITLAAIPAESSDSMIQAYDKTVALLEQETGLDVEFQNASDYAAVIEGMNAGQIDVASFGPFSYVIAKDSGMNIEAVAGQTDDKDEAPAYTALAYVPADSDIQSLADIKGKNVCLVDAASTSGYLVPMKGLMDEGMDINSDVTPVMAGGHDASLISTATGNCDVGFAHDTMLATLEETGQVDKGALRPIWESEPIPEDPVALNMDTLDQETADKIATVFREKANKPAMVEAGICESEDDCELPETIEYGFVEVTDEDFNPIRELCDATQAEACQK